jgi:hypothetical protein
LIKHANTAVHIVANAIGIRIGSTIAAANLQGVKLVAIAIASSCGHVGAPAFVNVPGSIATAAGI